MSQKVKMRVWAVALAVVSLVIEVALLNRQIKLERG